MAAVLTAVTVLMVCTLTASDSARNSVRNSVRDSAFGPRDGVWFGVVLDWRHDSLARYAARIGGCHPAVATIFADLPLSPAAAEEVDMAVEQAAVTGARLLLTLEPHAGLGAVTADVATELAARLAAYNARGVPVIVRFGHEMNGAWYPWGQRPREYIAAFRVLAEAVHRDAPASTMMWAPNYGGGYPFADNQRAALSDDDVQLLDTNGSGGLDSGDDGYAPYYPGDDAVDWVGLTVYHWGDAYPWGENEVPGAGKFEAMLTGRYARGVVDERAVPDFYATYGEGHHKPVAIPETAAFFAPGAGGADELSVKAAWWGQVFAPGLAERFPRLKMVNWFEWDKYESEVNRRVDWTVTRSPGIAAHFRTALPGWLRFADATARCQTPTSR